MAELEKVETPMENVLESVENKNSTVEKLKSASKSHKRKLEFKGKKGEYLSAIAKHLIKYFEDPDIEDFQINDFQKVTLIKRGDIKEFIDDENLTKEYIRTLMYFVSSIAPKKLSNTDGQVSLMLPVNKFRFTGRIGNSIGSGIKISIRLNDNIIYHNYKDFGLSELEFNFLVKYISKEAGSTFVIGGTGSGKTTFNNLLIQGIGENEVMNVIGDIHDYIFHGDQKVSEVFAKKDSDYINAFDLAMRSNPDRILVPELTGSNVSLILRAMNSGHKGFMLTMHSGNENEGVSEAFAKNLEMSGLKEANAQAIDKTINSNIDFLIHLKKHKGKRVVDKIVINNLYVQKEAQELGIFGFKKEKKIISKQRKKRQAIPVVKIIKELKKGGSKKPSQREISKKYGISRNTISFIANSLK